MHYGFSFLGLSVCILLLRLASFRATSWPLSRRRGWSGLGFSSGGGTLCHGGRTRRGGAVTVDGGVRTFVGVKFASVLVVSQLLVHEPNAPINTREQVCKWWTTDSRLRSSSVSWRFGRGG